MFIVCLHMFIVCLLLQTLQPHTNGPSVHMLLRCSRMSHELNTDVPRTDTIRRYPRGGGIWTASPPLACLQLAASGKHTQECYTVMYLHVMSACQHVSMSACQQIIALGQHTANTLKSAILSYTYILACIQTYMHACIHAYCTHTCMHAYMHTYVHACMHAYIHTCIHAYMHACIHEYIHTYTHPYIHTYIHTYIHACTTLITPNLPTNIAPY